MASHSDDDYALDANGRRVLVGLTAEETDEFIRLDEVGFVRPPPLLQQEWSRPEERRWLELYQKHQSAMQPFLASSKTRH
jgi:hypothetical protein